MVAEGKITSRVAKDLLPEILEKGLDVEVVAGERGLLQQSSKDELVPVVERIIEENPSVVEAFKSGKDASIQYLVGQGMKATKGAANPTLLMEIFRDRLS